MTAPSLCIALICSLFCTAAALAELTCPVAARPAKDHISLDTPAGPLLFSSREALRLYNANPARFTLGAARQFLQSGTRTQLFCPVTRQPASSAHKLDIEGCTLHFANASALRRFEHNMPEFLPGLLDCFVWQTKCPVGQEPIAATSVFHDQKLNRKVYFCCDKCLKAYEANPDQYRENLPR